MYTSPFYRYLYAGLQINPFGVTKSPLLNYGQCKSMITNHEIYMCKSFFHLHFSIHENQCLVSSPGTVPVCENLFSLQRLILG